MKRFKELFYIHFGKKEKTRKFSWVLRVGIILFLLAIVFTMTAIILTMLANIDGFDVWGIAPNDLSSYCGGTAVALAVISMFFIFCGKIKNKN